MNSDTRTARQDGATPAAMAADYECLRDAVVGRSEGGPRLGRAVIERAGMAAWIEVRSAVLPAPATVPPDGKLAVGSDGTEAVRILAGMALVVIGAER